MATKELIAYSPCMHCCIFRSMAQEKPNGDLHLERSRCLLAARSKKKTQSTIGGRQHFREIGINLELCDMNVADRGMKWIVNGKGFKFMRGDGGKINEGN